MEVRSPTIKVWEGRELEEEAATLLETLRLTMVDSTVNIATKAIRQWECM